MMILRSLEYPGIIQLIALYDTDLSVYIFSLIYFIMKKKRKLKKYLFISFSSLWNEWKVIY